METKKQLIIVPPLTDTLNKLKVACEAMSDEENIEISVIDDYKELSQFVAISGQCLIVFSNAKKCANFLQENKNLISRNHSKNILISNTEIPTLTLTKFTKAGLTESILDSTPPKSIMFKMKLHLRSIKSNNMGFVEENQIIKSSTDQVPEKNNLNQIIKKEIIANEESFSEKKKLNAVIQNNSEQKIENLKGKTQQKEEAIEKYWKTEKKNKDEENFERLPNGKISNVSNFVEKSISSTHLTHQKQNMDENVQSASNLKSNSKNAKNEKSTENQEKPNSGQTSNNQEASYNYLILKKKSNNETTSEISKGKKKLTELDLMASQSDNKLKEVYNESPSPEIKIKSLDNSKHMNSQKVQEQNLHKSQIDNSTHSKLKKISTPDEVVANKKLSAQNNQEEQKDEKKEKNKQTILDLLLSKKTNENQNNNQSQDTKNTKDKSNENETKKINDPLASKKQNDRLNVENDKISFVDLTTSSEDQQVSAPTKKSEISKEELIKKKQIKQTTLDIEETNSTKERSEPTQSYADSSTSNNSLLNGNEEIKSEVPFNNKISDQENDQKNLPKSKQYSSELTPEIVAKINEAFEQEKGQNQSKNAETLKEQTETTDKKGQNNSADMIAPNHQDGVVDRIDKFLRGGKAKINEDDWNFKKDKKDVILSFPKKKIFEDNQSDQFSKNHQTHSETTIDYRKIKEQFLSNEYAGRKQIAAVRNNSSPSDTSSFSLQEKKNFFDHDSKNMEFVIKTLNHLFSENDKKINYYEKISNELALKYNGFSIFYAYKADEGKFLEIYNTFLNKEFITNYSETFQWWTEFSQNQAITFDCFDTNIPTWNCKDLPGKDKSKLFWEDVELPLWADQELINKKVEFIFPLFDGSTQLGVIFVYFPKGVQKKNENSIITTLDVSRFKYLDLPRSKHREAVDELPQEVKVRDHVNSTFLSSIFNLFSRTKKAG